MTIYRCDSATDGRGFVLTLDLKSHTAGGASHHIHCRIDVARIEVVHLDLCDLFHLGSRHAAHLFFVRHRRTLGDVGRLLEQHGRRRALRDELERSVVVNRHDDRDHHAARLFGSLIKLLNELAEVNAVLTERSTDWRGWGRLPARNLKLRTTRKLFCHFIGCWLSAVGSRSEVEYLAESRKPRAD